MAGAPDAEEIRKKMEASTDPFERFRYACFSRGLNSVKGIGRTFRIFDDDGSKKLSFEEFGEGIRDYGLPFNEEQIKEIFQRLDADGSGTLGYNEFLIKLQPPMNESRKAVVLEAFAKADRTGDGVITAEDMKGVFDVTHHPKYKNGEWDQDQVIRELLDSLDMPEKDGKITKEEFLTHYAYMGAAIADDAWFNMMIRSAWKV